MLTQEKFAELVQKYQKDAYKFALSLCKNPTDAEDFVQEAFIHALQHKDDYDPTLPFIPWLFTIIRHKFLDHVRKEGRSPIRGVELVDMNDEGIGFDAIDPKQQTPEDLLINKESREALEKLKGRQREIIGQIFDGYSTTEVADMLGISKRTVEREVKAGVARLKLLVAKSHE